MVLFFRPNFPTKLNPRKMSSTCEVEVVEDEGETRLFRRMLDVCFIGNRKQQRRQLGKKSVEIRVKVGWGRAIRFPIAASRAQPIVSNIWVIFRALFCPSPPPAGIFFQPTHVVWTFDWLVMGCWTVNMCKLNEIENENFKMWVKI